MAIENAPSKVGKKELVVRPKNDTTLDIDINITAHKEGYYLYRTLKAVDKMRLTAKKLNIKTRVSINLDNSNEITSNIAQEYSKKNTDSIIYKNHFGDLSESRNFLISKSEAKYILFVDGDDLFTENFLCKAYETAETYGKPCVVSAEDIVKFSDRIEPVIFRVESTVAQPGIKTALFEINLYVSQNLVSTEIYKKVSYEQNRGNYGFEDWHWNTKVVEAGYDFLVAEGTSFFYRQKPDDQSLLRQNINANTVLRATKLFSPEKFITLPHDFYRPTTKSEQPQTFHKENPIKLVVRTTAIQTNTHNSLFYRITRKIYRYGRKLFKKQHEVFEVEDTDSLPKYTFSDQTREQWKKMNTVEPLIRMSNEVENHTLLYRYKKQHNLASAYHEFCKLYGEVSFTDVIFVPWINTGGADLAMMRLCRVLTKNGRKVLMVTTSGLPSQWEDQVRSIKGVTLIQSHDDIFKNLDHLNIKLLFLRIVQNWHIKTMTVMNSSIGFELIDRFGNAIKDTGCMTVVHSYAMPSENGWTIDAFPSYGASLERVDLTITDSETYKTYLQDLYGISPDRVMSLMLPISDDVRPKITSEQKHKILFANRLAREKQPDIAVKTLALLSKQGISMDMYGTKDVDYVGHIDFESLINNTSNVIYKGTFNGIGSVNFDDYDICFMPSLYEGTPNIVLEALKANLYIIGTDTGGMKEVVTSKYTGKLLPTTSSSMEFSKSITDYYRNRSLHSIKNRKSANVDVLKSHSLSEYERNVADLYKITPSRPTSVKPSRKRIQTLRNRKMSIE